MNPRNILIVGLGSIGKRHLRIARELFPKSKIAILRHQKNKSVPKDANEVFFTLSAAIQFKPKIAIVCTPASTHVEISRALVRQGIHVLIEKPISNQKKNLEKLNDEARKNKCILMIGYNLRFLSSLKKFKNFLDKNFIGNIYSVRGDVGQYLPDWRDIDYRKTVSAKKNLGGGVLLELSHELDYIRWIFGEIQSVQAQLSRQSNLDIDVEDTAHIILTFKKNKKYINLKASLNLDFIRHDQIRICLVIGEKGSLRWNGLTGDIELFKQNAKEWKNIYKEKVNQDDSYKNEWLHFIDCISKKKIPITSFKDGSKVLDIINSIKKSSSSGNEIEVKK